MNIARKAYSAVGALLLLEYVLQFYLAGAAIFRMISSAPSDHPTVQQTYNAFHTGDIFFTIHVFNGAFVIAITTLVLWALAFASKYPNRVVRLTGLLAGLLLLQDFLAGSLPFVPEPGFLLTFPSVVAGLHGTNGGIMLILAVWLTYKYWAFGNRGRKMMSSNYVAPKV